MSLEVKIPAVGESITSGLISAWHKKDGEHVESGDVLMTLETDKVSTEITAEDAGTLSIQVPEGQEVKIGQVVATIDDSAPASKEGRPKKGAEPKAALAGKPAPKKKAAAPEAVPKTEEPARKTEEPAAKPEEPASKTEEHAEKESALRWSSSRPDEKPAAGAADGRTSRRKLSPLRRKIAAQLVMAQQTAAILTTFNECDMTEVMDLRRQMQDDFVTKHGIKLGFMSFFVKAAVVALKAVPAVNGRMDGDDFVQNHYYDIGVAVGTERGLIVPVIRSADEKSFAEIEHDIAGYAEKARNGKISLEDLQGGVFTISNGGVYGSLLSTPILNPPQSGLLGLHKIQERPVALEGKVVIRPMMYLALSYDHRVIDGKEAVTFLVKLKDCIENPLRIMFNL